MPRYLGLMNSLLCLLLCAGIIWGWSQWYRQRGTLNEKWRSGTFIVALSFATFSSALSIFLMLHAAFTGGYPFYHPIELFCIRFGSLAAVLGIVASIAGKGTMRLIVAALSTLNLLLWFMDAVAQ